MCGARATPGSSTNAGRFPKSLRIRDRRDFLAIQRHGKTRHTRHFVVLQVARDDPGPCRCGVTVSRRVGHAVARNRVKRRVREFFRQHRHELPASTDFVFIARSGADELSYADVVDELRNAIGPHRDR